MARYWTITLVVLATAAPPAALAGGKGEKDIVIQDKLTKDDAKDTKRNFACKVHVVKLKAGNTYTIDMVSREFDSYLRLEDAKGAELAEDDDSGGDLNARIIFNCTKDGDYKVICTCFAEATGNFTLSVKKSMQSTAVASLHALLLGKAAPDFQGDFAVNGKPVHLSDLKGKVVLLDFWEVRSSAAVTNFAKLRQWAKAMKDEGLEVVGVTYYHSQLGHKVGFDKKAGKLTTPDAVGSRETDQTLLKDFAAYHKLDYLLMALPLQTALQAFNDYGVNGLPQTVLIDRKGVIRFIRVGDFEANAGMVEAEIKKLLAEK
jgi:peroxiredoxin